MKKAITPILFCLLMGHALIAGNPGSGVMFVTGNVTDKSSNETLAGVEVRVKGTNIVTYTDFDGNFYLPELPAGTYILEFHYITYSATTVVADGSDLEPELNVALQQR
ncbi:MAG TPA: carboxypeptidase-like regulatory domain-containing protein [Bacteroidia bacterium]|nr:carboxypeptidase-like regulatory domain-containing protein [Bacteroidia bacterium]